MYGPTGTHLFGIAIPFQVPTPLMEPQSTNVTWQELMYRKISDRGKRAEKIQCFKKKKAVQSVQAENASL